MESSNNESAGAPPVSETNDAPAGTPPADEQAAPGTAAPLELNASEAVKEAQARSIPRGPTSDSAEDVKAYRDGVAERADAERALGHGAEPRRVNPGATE